MRQMLFGVLVATSACVNVSTNPNDVSGTLPPIDGPTVQFDPANSIIPFPNDLIPRSATGQLEIPASCNESAATTAVRTGTLNQLNGFGTFEVGLQVMFSEAVSMSSLTNNIVLYQMTGTGAATKASDAIATTILAPSTVPQYPTGCSGASTMVTAVTVVPTVPLLEGTTYAVAVLSGVQTANAVAFIPSTTWALVRSTDNPVTFDASGDVTSNRTPLDPTNAAQLAEMQSLSGLWQVEAPMLTFLDGVLAQPRANLLLAWSFTTQTTVDPLQVSVANSPATQVPTAVKIAGLAGAYPYMFSLAGLSGETADQLIQSALGVSQTTCDGTLHCNAVADIFLGGIETTNFQPGTTNPMTGGAPIPGQWSDPVNPTKVGNPVIQVLVFEPTGTAPATGWPVVIFGHGLGEKKEDLFAIGSQLAYVGFASVAIDDVASGSRAIQNSNAAALGCADIASTIAAGNPFTATGTAYSASPQCFAPILTSDLGGTRDNIRQTVLDMESLAASLEACSGALGCVTLHPSSPTDTNPTPSTLTFDSSKIGYMGQSLGGIIGSTFVASSPDIKAAVLNVPGVGLIDILENTANLDIRCSLVDSLIAAGVVTGAPYDPTTMTGECTTEDWQTQPAYQTFAAAARWVLDPADGANYTRLLAPKKFIIQEVIDDQVVPNIACNDEGMLVGLTPKASSAYDLTTATAPPTPSPGVTSGATDWVQYTTTSIDAYQHGSLLEPVATVAGESGTTQMQYDALTFMFLNN